MKALVTGFHMLYRLSPDSKYPWSGENTGPIEIPVLNIPLLDSTLCTNSNTGIAMRSAAGTRGRSPGRPEDAAGARGRIPDDTPGAVAVSRSCAPRPAIRVLCARVPAVARGPQRGWVGRGSTPGQCAVRACGRGRACEGLRVPRCIGARVSRACARDGACAVRPSRAGRAERGTARVAWMAVVFHLLAFASVFDIYFRSPIVNGMAQTPQPPGHAVRVCGSARTHARTHSTASK